MSNGIRWTSTEVAAGVELVTVQGRDVPTSDFLLVHAEVAAARWHSLADVTVFDCPVPGAQAVAKLATTPDRCPGGWLAIAAVTEGGYLVRCLHERASAAWRLKDPVQVTAALYSSPASELSFARTSTAPGSSISE
jgi:hypothetical protein